MPEVKQHYDNLAERAEEVTYWEGQGYRMTHDDFTHSICPLCVTPLVILRDTNEVKCPNCGWHEPISGTMTFTNEPEPLPLPTEPPLSTHIATLVAVNATKARPARIKRVWQGQDYYYDCFATQTVKDEFVAGRIAIGDYVLVHFDEMGEQIVTAKVFKSW